MHHIRRAEDVQLVLVVDIGRKLACGGGTLPMSQPPLPHTLVHPLIRDLEGLAPPPSTLLQIWGKARIIFEDGPNISSDPLDGQALRVRVEEGPHDARKLLVKRGRQDGLGAGLLLRSGLLKQRYIFFTQGNVLLIVLDPALDRATV
eukprot:55821-Eustigmatos_ZCMA.PRE.3